MQKIAEMVGISARYEAWRSAVFTIPVSPGTNLLEIPNAVAYYVGYEDALGHGTIEHAMPETIPTRYSKNRFFSTGMTN